ncbi:MAG TPA: site-specific integrase [Solirubrobacteraceae bacterium]|nr:site-specific integrase [Solirubrobacteraceae bacterium]
MPRSVLIEGRRRSAVTVPGYRLGMKPANAGKKYPAEILTSDEIHRLMAACGRHGLAGPRNRAMIVTLWRGGLRVTEMLELRPKDIDLEAGTISILHGKGDRRRVIGIDPEAAAVIDVWLTLRRELRGLGAPLGTAPVFCVISHPNIGGRQHSSVVRETLKDLAVKAGIEKRVHPHGLRHTHAAELAREGVPVHVIRKQLGHSSLDTTERYINHLAPLEVIRAIQRRTWATHDLVVF